MSRTRLSASAIAAILAVVLSACGSSVKRTTPQTSSATSSSAAPKCTGEWSREVDATSKISFLIGQPPTMQTQADKGPDGTAVERRSYVCELTAAYGVVVGVTTGKDGGPLAFTNDLTAVAEEIRKQFVSQGVTDATVATPSKSTVDGHPVLDFRFTYTPPDGKPKPIWFVRLIGTPTALVTLQTIDFPTTPGDADLQKMQMLQAKLVAGVTIP